MGLLARRGRLFLLFLVTLGVVLGFAIALHSRHDWGGRPIIPTYDGDDNREGLRDVVKEGEGKIEDTTPVRVVEVDHSTHNHAQGWDAKQNTTIGYLLRYVEGVKGGQECEEDYGMKFIRRWQSYGKDYCLPFDDEGSSIATSPSQWQFASEDFRLQTKIRCHSLIPSHQTPEPNSVCLIERVVVDFGKLGVSICEGAGCHNDFYDKEKTVFFKPGVVRGHCRRVVSREQGWNTNNLVKTVGNWLVRGWEDLDAAPAKALATEVCTKENTVDHFVYFVSRYDTTNLYHASEDWIHAFSAFSVLEVPVENSQVVIADGLVPGPFLEVWKELYSRNHPILSVNDLHKAAQTKCFKYMGANVFGAVSPLCKQEGRETPCGNSTLVRGFRDFFLASFKVKYLLPSEDKLTVTVIQRKNYARAAGPVQHISRQIQNHDQLVKMTQDMFPTAEIRSVDFAGLSFRDQLKLIRTTDILMGAHGAALSHMMFLPSTSVSIEFWIDDRYGNYHYVNMGKWLGITHLLEHQSNPLNLDQTRAHLEEAAALVAKNKKRRLYDH